MSQLFRLSSCSRCWSCCRAAGRSAGSTSAAPGCRTARRRASCCPTTRWRSSSTRTRCSRTPPRRIFRVTPYVLFGCMALAAGIVPVVATDLPFAPAADIIALVGLFAHRARVRGARGDGHRHLVRRPRRAPRDDGRLPRRAGDPDDALHRRLHQRLDPAHHHRRDARAPRVRDLSEPRLRRGRVPDGAARRKRARPGGQPDHAPRAHHAARGA